MPRYELFDGFTVSKVLISLTVGFVAIFIAKISLTDTITMP